MIKNKRDLDFYIIADRIMGGGNPRPSFFEKMKSFIYHLMGIWSIQDFLKAMRETAYLYNVRPIVFSFIWFRCILGRIRYQKLGRYFGFSIGYNVFGYGLFIPHYGTIVVNKTAKIGNYALIQTSTCIGENGNTIGDSLCLYTGSQLMGPNLKLNNNVTIASHSLVNKYVEESNVLLAGCPALIKRKNYTEWWKCSEEWYNRILLVEKIRKQFYNN